MTESRPTTDTTEPTDQLGTAEPTDAASAATSTEAATESPPADSNGAASLDDGAGPDLDPVTQSQVEAVASGDVEVEDAPAAEPEAEPLEADAPAADVTAVDGTEVHEVDEVHEPTPAPEATTPVAGPRTVGRFIADALRAAGVRHAFTVPGESFLGLLDGLTEAGIRVVATRHEGGAAFMAEAHGQLTGRPAACLATRAVGAANLAIGIHTARQNSTPMFALVGQVERRFRGREAFQEVDLVETFGHLAKWAVEPSTIDEIPAAISEAIRIALGGRPGPVLISLPEDLLDEQLPAGVEVDLVRPAPPRADVPQTQAVLQLLASARRPVILAGAGVLRARTSSDLTRLAELLHVPVIAAWRRGDVVSNDHPLFLGMAGYGAPAVVRERLEGADALLVLGSRLSEITTFGYRIPADGVPWAHVDLAPRHGADGLRPPDIAIESDARAFVRGAVQRLRGAVLDAALVDERRAANEADRASWEAASKVEGGDWSGPGVHPGRVITTLRRVLPEDAILTTDAGNFGGWAARGFRFRRPGTFLGPTSGAMGYGLPAAIAAALVHRDRAVVALVGDGGLAMTMAELETAVRERARVIVLAFDNERYGTIRMHQGRRDGEPVGTDLGPIDFAAVARACGARGIRIENDDAFEPALRQALASERATVLHLTLDRRWVSVDEPAVH